MCSGNVYSPKIREDLIPVLFKLAKTRNTAMTKIVDELLRNELQKRGLIDEEQANYNGRATEGFFKRQESHHGLRGEVLSAQFFKYDDYLF